MADEFVENYSYRIEFQVRGLPHLHGVFWLNETKLNEYKDGNGNFIDEKVTGLIDDYISVSLESKDESLNDVVRQVNTHKHTKSCQRGNKQCRFDFPKLPSEKTLIAKPLCEETLGKEKFEETLKKFRGILERVKQKLSIMNEKELETYSLNKLLEEMEISSEDYHKALSVSQRG